MNRPDFPPASQRAPSRSVSRWASLGHALRGLRVFWGQPNARIHTVAAVLVVGLGLGLNIEAAEWCAVTLAMALVMGAEAMNTAVELAVDLAQPDWHPTARDAKDVAAAAVLLCSVGALGVGFWVFGLRLWAWL